MDINEKTLKFGIKDETLEKISKYKTFENLFDITLGTFFREIFGEDYYPHGWNLLEKIAIHYFPEFVNTKLFNSIIDNLERLNDNKCYGKVRTFSKNSLLAMKAQWDILNEEERLIFMRPAHGLPIGYILAGAQYYSDLFTDCGKAEDYMKAYPTFFNTSYISYNMFGRQKEYSLYHLEEGWQYQNIDGYLREMSIRKNKMQALKKETN